MKRTQCRYKFMLAGLLFLFSLWPLYLGAQEQETPPAGTTGGDSTVYKIRKIDFDVTGRSRPFALLYNGKLAEGDEMTGRENLEFYIRDRTQQLVNQRVLEDDVHIDYTLDEAGEDGKVPVDLTVTVRDTWNIMVFPKPVYDNSGFDLTLKARDYNFFGTMNPLRIDLGYFYDTKKNSRTRYEGSFNFLIDTDIPFQALGFNWNINFDNEFNYTQGDPLNYRNSTGIFMELPFKATTFTFGAEHYINVNEKNSDKNNDRGYGKNFDGVFNSVEFSTSWEIPTGIKVFGNNELTYTPEIAEEIVYNPAGQDKEEWRDLRKGPFTTLDQTLGFGRIDWIGNFRKGLDVSFNNSNVYNHNQNVWNNDYSINTTGHFLFGDFFGLSAQLELRHWFHNYPDKLKNNLGDNLRGILNDEIQGNLMLSLNLEFPFKIFTARPSDWFNKSKMRIFNFELHLSPVVDIGLVHLPDRLNDHETDQDTLNMYYTGGIEAIVFPEFMRSFIIRFSFGFDLKELAKTRHIPSPEFFIGLGHYFE
ncbi:hypothetical protein FACS1894140_4620 [Spirochaetia bacterium]|nr:hypothetical protein FACS1894140_4620 [Spirochaetia bacterium]